MTFGSAGSCVAGTPEGIAHPVNAPPAADVAGAVNFADRLALSPVWNCEAEVTLAVPLEFGDPLQVLLFTFPVPYSAHASVKVGPEVCTATLPSVNVVRAVSPEVWPAAVRTNATPTSCASGAKLVSVKAPAESATTSHSRGSCTTGSSVSTRCTVSPAPHRAPVMVT